MPPGWTQQWDQNSQRWFYIEQATGRTQWDPPAHLPPGPYAPPPTGAPYVAPGGHNERALFGNTQGHQGHDYTPSGHATNEAEKKKDKDKGHSTAMLAAAGIGGIAAGAWIGHELSMPFSLYTFHSILLTNPSRRRQQKQLVILRPSPRRCSCTRRRSLRRSSSSRSVCVRPFCIRPLRRPGLCAAASRSHPRCRWQFHLK